MAHKVVILDSSLNPITELKAFSEIDKQGYFLEYINKLSGVGTCHFRILTKDPMFTQNGDILQPYINHVRVYRDNALVFSGVIVDNPKRTRNFVDVVAYSYLFLLKKILVTHDAPDGLGGENYRTLRSGTLATNVQTILTEAFASNPILTKGWKLGSIVNPTFPLDSDGNALYSDSTGASLTGPYTFSNNFYLKFDYRDILYVISSLGIYSNSDFEVTSDLVFNFSPTIGNKTSYMFEYNSQGTGGIEDYNIPLNGLNMANRLTGVAADNQFQVFSTRQDDADSVRKYGPIEGVAAFKDAKDKGVLNTRLTEELRNISDPINEIHVILNNRSYPLGQWGLGDTAVFSIRDHFINVREPRRIVGYHVQVHSVGRETIRVMTNPPRPNQ